MRVPGLRVKKTRYVQTDLYVVAVEAEMVIPTDDPSEPCYEPDTVQLLRQVQDHAVQGDLEWLARHGKVYVALSKAA